MADLPKDMNRPANTAEWAIAASMADLLKSRCGTTPDDACFLLALAIAIICEVSRKKGTDEPSIDMVERLPEQIAWGREEYKKMLKAYNDATSKANGLEPADPKELQNDGDPIKEAYQLWPLCDSCKTRHPGDRHCPPDEQRESIRCEQAKLN